MIWLLLLLAGCFQALPTVDPAAEVDDEPPEPASDDPSDESPEDPVEDPVEDPIEDPVDDPIEDPVGDPEACNAVPITTWPTALPEDRGFDPGLLQEAADYASDHPSNCLLVVRQGAIIGEWYWQGTTPTTKVKNWSVAKSYASTVVGVAIDRGDLEGVDQPASDHIVAWQGTPREDIRLHDLMAMSSGLAFDAIADNVTMPLADDMTSLAVDAPAVNPPGALWEYNNHAVQSVEPVIRAATGLAADEYADQHLFGPLGMDVEWKRDAVGQPAMYMNARTSCRDNARLGQLFLQRGCWGEDRILSEEWIDAATSPSTSMNRGYGYWWWLNGEEPTLDSVHFTPKPGGQHAFAPDDAFCAVGLGSQFIEVVPSLDLVVVRMGTAPHDVDGAWLNPLEMLDEVQRDGEQIVHNGVLERVLDALIEP